MNIYVGNLSYQTRDADLEDLFASFGEVTSARVVMDRETGRSRGFGFVEMASAEAGDNAIRELDGNDFMGRNLKVNEARPRPDGGGRRPPRGDYQRY
ncbi:MAG: RNA-binding protein [Candidatus Sericytochromatia bacterium]|nr:RNA-binding protein [Candidatus Sericytochromatia bacterium]